jgi:hypothetical protein
VFEFGPASYAPFDPHTRQKRVAFHLPAAVPHPSDAGYRTMGDAIDLAVLR